MMTTSSSENHIYVLYASQTGNSEQAARDVCDQLVSKLPAAATCSHMQLDDFLELQKCAWTPVVIIISSSYGVGQAPLGGYRFRALCDSILANDDDDNKIDMLKGISFFLLGLGDSKYRTYFENPTTIHKAMVKAGATLVGTIGKADASGEQLAIIAEWIDQLWVPLGKALGESNPPSADRLLEIQHATIELCRQSDPDFLPVPKTARWTMTTIANTTTTTALVALVGALLAAILGHFLMSK